LEDKIERMTAMQVRIEDHCALINRRLETAGIIVQPWWEHDGVETLAADRNEARARLAAVEAALSFLPKREWFMVQLRSIDDDWVLDGYVLVSAKREQWLTLLDALSASPAQQAAPDPVRELLISLSDGVLEMMEHEGIGRTNIEVIRRRRDDAARALGLGEQVEPDPRLRAYDHAAQWVIDTGECLFCDYEDGQHEDFCPLSGASPEPDSATQP
ncbi:MAG TPA: hypothetical protein VII92_10405, partial [Anaerolineae bacterium]